MTKGIVAGLEVLAVVIVIVPMVVLSGSDLRGPTRRVIQKVTDPTGKWTAVVDEVSYVGGLLTHVADRVCLVKAESQESDGVLVFSEDAKPDEEKPSVAWTTNRLRILVSPGATILHRTSKAEGVEIEIEYR